MEIMDLLQTKRTYRRFDQSRPVPQQVVDDMMEAARLASCAGNKQPLRYLAVCSEELVEQIGTFKSFGGLVAFSAQLREDEF